MEYLFMSKADEEIHNKIVNLNARQSRSKKKSDVQKLQQKVAMRPVARDKCAFAKHMTEMEEKAEKDAQTWARGPNHEGKYQR